MENKLNESEASKRRGVMYKIKWTLIASMWFIFGWALGDLRGHLWSRHNLLILAIVVVALAVIIFVHKNKSE